jgi:hypothetical protein
MKTRKLLPLLALAVLALFALSSCDQMLESIYPEQTNPPASNTIYLTVQTWYSYVGDNVYYGPLMVEVLDSSAYTVVASDSRYLSYNYYDPIVENFSFYSLDDGNYTVNTWLDTNYNGVMDGYEYQASSYSLYLSDYSTQSITLDVKWPLYYY